MEEIKSLEGLKAQKLVRQKAINKYLENPNYCKQCGKIIGIPDNGIVQDIKVKKFCNRSCAASFNNTGNRKHGEAPKLCQCGNNKVKGSNKCKKCRTEIQTNESEQKTLFEISNKKAKYSASKYNGVRDKARAKLIKLGVKKRCKFCSTDEFIDVLEVAHIKGVREFSEDTKLKEVNNISNLMYVCPSHHRMFDKGLIKLPDEV
jgi:hypothetical protein